MDNYSDDIGRPEYGEGDPSIINVVVVEPGKRPYEKTIKRTLESMQEIVGGLIEQVCPFEDDVSVICNEEGKIIGLPANRALRYESGEIYDIIAGTFFIAYSPPDSEYFESIPPELADKYCMYFKSPECFFYAGGKVHAVSCEPDGCADTK